MSIRRREFMTALSGVPIAWPLATRGQPVVMPVIGWLSSESREDKGYRVNPFRQGLKESGYIEGQNMAIEYRYADRAI
jgi:hypothetical protein